MVLTVEDDCDDGHTMMSLQDPLCAGILSGGSWMA